MVCLYVFFRAIYLQNQIIGEQVSMFFFWSMLQHYHTQRIDPVKFKAY